MVSFNRHTARSNTSLVERLIYTCSEYHPSTLQIFINQNEFKKEIEKSLFFFSLPYRVIFSLDPDMLICKLYNVVVLGRAFMSPDL